MTAPATELKTVYNCWTIEQLPNGDDFAQFSRPQDWGDPRWMYRVYVLEAFGHRCECHCWLDSHVQEAEHARRFAMLIVTVLLPGQPRQLCGRDYLAEDDFWDAAWGPMPPHWGEDEEADDD